MNEPDFCGGCPPFPVAPICRGSFRRNGVLKVHWECWSECNLACSFCYRAKGSPLDTGSARRLLDAIATSGALGVVFAGGDPSIRPDISVLMRYAHSLGLNVEVQTNAQIVKPEFLEALVAADLVGLSLDGPDTATHDGFRDKPGNFDSVLSLLRVLESEKVPVVVRTIVARPNFLMVPRLAYLLNKLPNLVRWSLLEFSAVGDGFMNRERYELDRALFNVAVEDAARNFANPTKLNIYRDEDKIGTYALVTPSGYVYGTSETTVDGIHPTIGSILQEHLSVLVQGLPFSMKNHQQRYASLFGRTMKSVGESL